MALMKIYKIKRLRKEYNGKERWVEIGRVVINLDDETGSVYLNAQDEIWRLFETGEKE